MDKIKLAFEENKVVIVALVAIIATFLIYRYVYENHDLLNDLGIRKSTENMQQTTPPSVNRCLDDEIQDRIARDINKKLREIDACPSCTDNDSD